jgi:hypothetical protein
MAAVVSMYVAHDLFLDFSIVVKQCGIVNGLFGVNLVVAAAVTNDRAFSACSLSKCSTFCFRDVAQGIYWSQSNGPRLPTPTL